MAYSDYGGYAYKNGTRQVDHSDAVWTEEGLVSTAGSYPGFTHGTNANWQHALLGCGNVLVGLYKQSSLTIWVNGEEIDPVDFLIQDQKHMVRTYDDGSRYLDKDAYTANGIAAEFSIAGCSLEVYFEHDDNFYMYARLIQPDGNIWTGFSGYGVGAGLENAGYGYSTDACIEKLDELFGFGHSS